MINTLCKHGIEAESCSYCLEYTPQAINQSIHEASKEDSLQALQQEAEQLLNHYVEAFNLLPIIIKVKKVNRGFAYYDSRKITIPIWPIKAGRSYYIAYILHEISHFINHDIFNGYGHGMKFKEVEKNLLKEHGLVPVYSRAYIKELRTEAGEVLYNRKTYRAGQVQA